MLMTLEEIYQAYKGSETPFSEISRLAKLNNCSIQEIELIIKRQQQMEELMNEKIEKIVYATREEAITAIENRLDEVEEQIKALTQEYKRLANMLKEGIYDVRA